MCSKGASEANLTECILVDACSNPCSSIPVGIQCYGIHFLHVCTHDKKQKDVCFASFNYTQYLTSVLKVKSVWQMVTSAKRGGWKYVLVECGEVFAEMAGTRRMLIFSVNNWT